MPALRILHTRRLRRHEKKTHEQQPLVKGQRKKNFYFKDTTKKAKRQWTTKLLLTQKAEYPKATGLKYLQKIFILDCSISSGISSAGYLLRAAPLFLPTVDLENSDAAFVGK